MINDIAHGNVTLNETFFESVAEVFCADGYRLEDGETNVVLHCQSNALWSKQNLSCQGMVKFSKVILF